MENSLRATETQMGGHQRADSERLSRKHISTMPTTAEPSNLALEIYTKSLCEAALNGGFGRAKMRGYVIDEECTEGLRRGLPFCDPSAEPRGLLGYYLINQSIKLPHIAYPFDQMEIGTTRPYCIKLPICPRIEKKIPSFSSSNM